MKTFFLIFFIVIGALDFAYGLIYKDQLSIVAGGAIVAITIYIWKKKNSGFRVKSWWAGLKRRATECANGKFYAVCVCWLFFIHALSSTAGTPPGSVPEHGPRFPVMDLNLPVSGLDILQTTVALLEPINGSI